ncbi:hypothetical protein BGW39_003836 [Mortierella sp. 14UC]|nr:hypothetical protein BGW39_003836 [Mortierella sp. 14UC]
MMPYRPPPPSDFDLQQDNREWQWRDRIGWVAFQPSFAPGAPIDYGTPAEDVKDEEGSEEDVIDYDALFQKIEAERARRVHERQKALDESVRPKSFVEEADTHVVPYPLPPGVVASTLAKDLLMDGEESRLQSLQRGPTGRILQVEAHHHPQSRQYVVLWDDILEVFPDATNVLHGTVVVTRARDADLRL